MFDVKNGTLIKNPQQKITPALKLRNYLSWHSHLYSLIYFSVIDNQKLRDFLIKINLLNPPYIELNNDMNSLIYINSKNQIFEHAINKTLLLLEGINNHISKNNMTLILFIVPAKEQVDSSKMKHYIKTKDLDTEKLNITKVQEIISNSMEKYNITTIEPLDQFKRHNLNNTFYYDIDGHWNKKGHQFVANIIYEKLIKLKIVS